MISKENGYLRRARSNRREREVHVSRFPKALSLPSVSGFANMFQTQSSFDQTTRRRLHAASSLGRQMRFAAEMPSLRNMSHTSQKTRTMSSRSGSCDRAITNRRIKNGTHSMRCSTERKRSTVSTTRHSVSPRRF
jgi:hypothetical protein